MNNLIGLALIAIAMNDVQSPPISFVAPGSAVEEVSTGLRFTEGPCELRDGVLIFSDIPANVIYGMSAKVRRTFREPSFHANGNTLDPLGRLVTCEHGARRVSRQERDGTITVLAEKYDGKRLNSPNDVVVGKDGVVFFTDPPYGIRPEQAELSFQGVYAIVKDRVILLDKSFDRPNGLVLSPDEKWLYVADTAKSHIRKFRISPSPFSPGEKGEGAGGEGSGLKLEGGEIWASTPHPDGIRVDSEGRIWSASGDGVNVISPEGKIVEVVKFPQQPANLCFSRDGKTLFVTARTGVYKVAVRVKGIAP